MRKVFLCIASLCLGFGAFAQDNEAEAALAAMGSTAYWNNWKTDYELWDSYWEVDDQTTNVQVLKGLSPANGIEVEESSIYPSNSYKITYDGDILIAENNRTAQNVNQTTYQKFGIRWQYWDGECENYQKVNPITGQKWTNDCHKVAKGYSVDFSEPANRLVRFQYQLVSTVEDPSIRVDLWDIKGRKSSVSDGSTIVSHIKTIVETNNTYLPNDEDSWHWFEGAFCDEGEDELSEGFDTYSWTIGDICDQAYWWNGVNFSINGEGYQAPADVKLKLDLKHIIGLEFYINDEEKEYGKSTLYIKNLIIGNDITRNTEAGQQTEFKPLAAPTIQAAEVEIVEGVVYSKGNIVVTNILGQTVKSGSKQLNITNLPEGIYFIQTQEGTVKFAK